MDDARTDRTGESENFFLIKSFRKQWIWLVRCSIPSQRLADVKEGGVKSLLGVEKQVFDCFWPNSGPIIYGNTIVNSGLEKACSRRWNPREAILIKDPNTFF